MARQIDCAVRLLAERHLGDLAPALLAGRQVEVIAVEHSELKIVERLTDLVVRARVNGEEMMLHLEFQLRHDNDLPERVLAYHSLLRHRYWPIPVLSTVIYLMPEAPARPVPRGLHQGQVDFQYEVICPWALSISLEQVRRNPVLAPIAVLTPAISEPDLPELRRAIEDAQTLSADRREDLRVLTYFIGGRRFALDLLTLMIGSEAMEESVTYRFVMEKGREEGRLEGLKEGLKQGQASGLRRAILDLVEARLGQVQQGLEQRLTSLDADALHTLFSQLLGAADQAQLRSLLAG